MREPRARPSRTPIRTWHAPNSRPTNLQPTETIVTKLVLSARSVKLVVPLDAADVAAMPVPEGRATFAVTYIGGMLEASVNAKSLRKVQSTIRDHGAEGVFVMLQGKLGRGGEILECGLVAQVKAAAPAAKPEAKLATEVTNG
jgi:hypothetical protein